METILFVGSNPSNASTCDIAFHGSTKSSKILTSWCKDLSGCLVHLNVLNKKTENNRPIKKGEFELERLKLDIEGLNPTKIIALGKTAAKALTLLHLDFYEMPHPSPRNRLLNDPKFVGEKVKGLTEFCNKVNPNTELVSSD